jgi:hypothetical protein
MNFYRGKSEEMARPAGVSELSQFNELVWLAGLKLATHFCASRFLLASDTPTTGDEL